MKIAIVANSVGSLSETFVRREQEALSARGHTCIYLTGFDYSGPASAPPTVPVIRWSDAHARQADFEVLYASMGLLAHRRAFEIAKTLNVPVCFRVWEGHDSFATPSPEFYSEVSRHRLCLGVIVEDEWMRQYAIDRMGVDPAKLHVVPNSVDVERFTPRTEPRADGPVRVLAVCRYVPKKGLIHLVRAFRRLPESAAQLILVGYGPEEAWLREAAARTSNIEFRAPVPESALPALYRSADIFAAPCVKSGEDADGIPTTVLEVMSCGLPVVVSDLLSAGCYVQHDHAGAFNGVMVPPGDEDALAQWLACLCENGRERKRLGDNARAFAVEHLDINKNIVRIEAVLVTGSREKRWEVGMEGIELSRRTRTPERQATYDDISAKAFAFWNLNGDDVLDVGCGDGWMQEKLQARSYVGVDVMPWPAGAERLWYFQGCAEALPFPDANFTAVVCNSVLQHVQQPAQALSEMHRVLKPGGKLRLEVNTCHDPNPIFLHWWREEDVIALVEAAGFKIEKFEPIGAHRFLLVNGVKR